MSDLETTTHTRRNVLGMALGFLAAGCATGTAGARAGGGAGFPSARPWCWERGWTTNPATATPVDLFGQLIMQTRNPYCAHPAEGATECHPEKPATWPHQLTDETTWKYLTEFDFRSRSGPGWEWLNAHTNVYPSRSMRIPYLIKHTKAKKEPRQPGPPQHSFGRESLLVGYEENDNSVANAVEWTGPATMCSGPGETVGKLAQFILINMMRDSDTKSFYMPNWNTPASQGGALENGGTERAWFFRRSLIVVDYMFRIPIATGSGTTAEKGGWIYIGYEGGGAY